MHFLKIKLHINSPPPPPRRWCVDMDNIFLFSNPKKLRGEFFFHFDVFKQDQRTHAKRNEQQGAQTLVPIDIFAKK